MLTNHSFTEFFFRTHYQQLLAFGQKYLEKDNVEDIIQDLMIHVLSNSNFISMKSPKSYLYKALYNRCLKELNKKKLILYISSTEIPIIEIIEDCKFKELVQIDNDSSISVKVLMKEIKNLPFKCRKIFILSVIKGLNTTQISEIMGITNRTVETHLHHARKKLKKRLVEFLE